MFAIDLFRRAWGILARIRQRQRQRQELLELDDRILRDVGIDRADAIREGRKPFWRV